MSYSHFERLSPMDLSFLAGEDGRAHMHIGSVGLYEAEPLRCASGGVDYERILEFIEAQLYKVPRTRQKLAWVPGFGQPVWVDDAHFNLRFHVRHAALPPPGDVRRLKRLAGEEERIAIPPKEWTPYQFPLALQESLAYFYFLAFALPEALLLLGIHAWYRQRQ